MTHRNIDFIGARRSIGWAHQRLVFWFRVDASVPAVERKAPQRMGCSVLRTLGRLPLRPGASGSVEHGHTAPGRLKGGDVVVAILDHGRFEDFCVHTDGSSESVPARVGRPVYSVTEFS